MGNWPADRPVGYDPDLWWDEETEAWVSTFVNGPGSRVEHLLAIGEEGEIYYGVV